MAELEVRAYYTDQQKNTIHVIVNQCKYVVSHNEIDRIVAQCHIDLDNKDETLQEVIKIVFLLREVRSAQNHKEVPMHTIFVNSANLFDHCLPIE